mmetsp:Transcript_163193/g.518547  ORF Transcript_163193/g.518547 Transcript_163193/m.518547 type:complete len:219 (+) Transcript_163193:209-865(+)
MKSTLRVPCRGSVLTSCLCAALDDYQSARSALGLQQECRPPGFLGLCCSLPFRSLGDRLLGPSRLRSLGGDLSCCGLHLPSLGGSLVRCSPRFLRTGLIDVGVFIRNPGNSLHVHLLHLLLLLLLLGRGRRGHDSTAVGRRGVAGGGAESIAPLCGTRRPVVQFLDTLVVVIQHVQCGVPQNLHAGQLSSAFGTADVHGHNGLGDGIVGLVELILKLL